MTFIPERENCLRLGPCLCLPPFSTVWHCEQACNKNQKLEHTPLIYCTQENAPVNHDEMLTVLKNGKIPSKHTGKGNRKWPKFTNNPSSIPVRSTSRIPKVLISCRPVPGVCGVGAASALAPARILILYCLYNLCMSYQSYFKGLKIKMLEVIYRKFKFDEDWWASIHVSHLCARTELTQ